MSQNIIQILKEIHKNSQHNKYWNISWSLGEELSKITKQKNPKKILEIGTSNGFSSLWILKSIEETAILTSIEVDNSRFLEAKQNFKKAGIKNQIKQIQGEIFELLQTNQIQEKYDMIFLDAAQKKYLELIKLLEKKEIITKDTLIIADNVISHKNMDKFLEYMFKNYNCEILEIDSGFLIAFPNN